MNMLFHSLLFSNSCDVNIFLGVGMIAFFLDIKLKLEEC